MRKIKYLDAPQMGQLPLFSVLTPEQAASLSQQCPVLSFGKNACIYEPDSVASHLYLVLSGWVKTSVAVSEHQELVRRLVRPGEFFGFGGIMGRQRRDESARSLNAPVTVLCIPVAACRAWMQANGHFAQQILHMVTQSIQRCEHRLEVLLSADVRTRIRWFFDEHAFSGARADGYDTLLRFGLTQKDIANMVGATRQTVAAILNEWKRENAIDFSKGRFRVQQPESELKMA